jgi:hypothetical protein
LIYVSEYVDGVYDPDKPMGNAARWLDTDTRTAFWLDGQGSQQSRPFNDQENAYADALEHEGRVADAVAKIKADIAGGIADLQVMQANINGAEKAAAAGLANQIAAAKQAAAAQAPTVTTAQAGAASQRTVVAAARSALATQKSQVDAFAPGAAYSQAQQVAIRNAISDALTRVDTGYQGVDDVLARLDGIYGAILQLLGYFGGTYDGLDALNTWRQQGVDPAMYTVAGDLVWIAQTLTQTIDLAAHGG